MSTATARPKPRAVRCSRMGCTADMSDMRSDALWCSPACRERVRRGESAHRSPMPQSGPSGLQVSFARAVDVLAIWISPGAPWEARATAEEILREALPDRQRATGSEAAMNPDWTMELPTEWKTGEFCDIRCIAESTDLAYGQALLVSGILTDGTNFMAVIWPAGQRILRMGPVTDWAVQEHFTGRLPSAEAGGDTIDFMWSVAVKSIIEAKHQTIAEIGPPV